MILRLDIIPLKGTECKTFLCCYCNKGFFALWHTKSSLELCGNYHIVPVSNSFVAFDEKVKTTASIRYAPIVLCQQKIYNVSTNMLCKPIKAILEVWLYF